MLLCLVFAVPFGGVGLWASWTMASSVRDAWAARDWVKVRADVITAEMRESSSRRSTTYRADALYRYTFAGKDYTGSRLGLIAMGSDNIGDWQEEMADFLQSARDEKRPITVYVNPDQPAEAVVDRAIRWPMMLFLTPFAVLFGGVGVGALYAAWSMITEPADGSARAHARAEARRQKALQPGSGLGVIWLVAILWNAFTFPLAGLAVPDLVRQGNWFALLILLFPLVGLLILWSALKATWEHLRSRTTGEAEKARRPSQSAPLTGRPASFFDPPGTKRAFAPDVALPPEFATMEEHGGTITIHYAGGFLSALLGRLTVVAGPGGLHVERNGPFGRKEFKATPSAITAITPALSYTVSGGGREKNYYSITATTRDGKRIPLARGVPGGETANWLAARIAKAVKVASGHVDSAQENPFGQGEPP